jgi:hypothetical protein
MFKCKTFRPKQIFIKSAPARNGLGNPVNVRAHEPELERAGKVDRHSSSLTQGCQIFLGTIYQMTTKYTKFP